RGRLPLPRLLPRPVGTLPRLSGRDPRPLHAREGAGQLRRRARGRDAAHPRDAGHRDPGGALPAHQPRLPGSRDGRRGGVADGAGRRLAGGAARGRAAVPRGTAVGVSAAPGRIFPWPRLHEFTAGVFRHLGVPDAEAALSSDVLSSADRRGIDSHGVARLRTYYDLLAAGQINPRPHPRVVRETASTATVDGDNGLGLVVGPWANEVALRKAAEA